MSPIQFWLFLGTVFAENAQSYLNYSTGIYVSQNTQIVSETANLYIRINLTMPYINESNLNCSIDQNSQISDTIDFINDHYRQKFDELSRNFGVPVEKMSVIKVHFTDCRRSKSDFYCGYPELSCCSLKDANEEILRCIHDNENKQVWLNLEKQHYTSKCFRLETSLPNNLPSKRYYVGSPTLNRNEMQRFKMAANYETRFPYDWDQFRRLRDLQIDSAVFLDATEHDKLTLTFTPTWISNKGYGCIVLLIGANSYADDSKGLSERYEIEVSINDTIKCDFHEVEFFDPKAYDVRTVMFDCPIVRLFNIIVKISILENCRFHEVMIFRDTCINMIDYLQNKQQELNQLELEPVEDLPLSPPKPFNRSISTSESVTPIPSTTTISPTKRVLSLAEVLAIGSTVSVSTWNQRLKDYAESSNSSLDMDLPLIHEIPLNPIPMSQLEGSATNEGSAMNEGSNALSDDIDYVNVMSEFNPIDEDLIPDSDFTFQYVKIKRKNKRSVFSTISDIAQYYAYGASYTNLFNINKFNSLDKRLEKIKEILALNIKNMEKLTHSLQADMNAITDLICEMSENIEVNLLKIKASLMMTDLKMKLSKFYGQCNGRQVPFLYSSLIRQFLCTVNIRSCQTLVRLVNCEVVHVRTTGHKVSQMHLMLKLSVPIVDTNLALYKQIELPKAVQNGTVENEFAYSEMLRDSLTKIDEWSMFKAPETNVSYKHLIFTQPLPNFIVMNMSDNSVYGEVENLQSQDFLMAEDVKQTCVEIETNKLVSKCAPYQISKIHEKCYIKHIDSLKSIYVVANEKLRVINSENSARECSMCLIVENEKSYDCDVELINRPIELELDLLVQPDLILLDDHTNWNTYNDLNAQLRKNISELDEKLNFELGYKLLKDLNYKDSKFWTVVAVILIIVAILLVACFSYVMYRRIRFCIESENLGTSREVIELLSNRQLRNNDN